MRRKFGFLIALLVTLFVASPALADLTVSNVVQDVWGKKRVKVFDIAFDSSYAFGGESLTKASRGFASIDQVVIQAKDGYTFVYDETNEKVKVFAPAPAVVYEEQHTITNNMVYLDYPAAYLMNVAQANANVKICTSGTTLMSTGECKPYGTWTAGGRSGVTFEDAATGTVYITYITQAWKEVWDNLVQNETVTVTTNNGEFAYKAAAIQGITLLGGVATNSARLLDKDDTAATTECTVDWAAGAGDVTTGVSTFANDGISSLVATYVKKPSSGFLYDNWVEEETSQQTISGTSKYALNYSVLLWSYAGQVPVNGSPTQVLINDGGTTGKDEAYFRWKAGVSPFDQIVMGEDIASTTATYIKGKPSDIPFLVPLEVKNGQDLSALTGVQVIMIGR